MLKISCYKTEFKSMPAKVNNDREIQEVELKNAVKKPHARFSWQMMRDILLDYDWENSICSNCCASGHQADWC